MSDSRDQGLFMLMPCLIKPEHLHVHIVVPSGTLLFLPKLALIISASMMP